MVFEDALIEITKQSPLIGALILAIRELKKRESLLGEEIKNKDSQLDDLRKEKDNQLDKLQSELRALDKENLKALLSVVGSLEKHSVDIKELKRLIKKTYDRD